MYSVLILGWCKNFFGCLDDCLVTAEGVFEQLEMVRWCIWKIFVGQCSCIRCIQLGPNFVGQCSCIMCILLGPRFLRRLFIRFQRGKRCFRAITFRRDSGLDKEFWGRCPRRRRVPPRVTEKNAGVC